MPIFVPLDVAHGESVAAAAKRIDDGYGRLDVLINNAGIARGDGERGLPSDTTVATLRTVFETNVFGVVAVTNALLPLLRRAPAARIVNVSSEVGSIATARAGCFGGSRWTRAAGTGCCPGSGGRVAVG